MYLYTFRNRSSSCSWKSLLNQIVDYINYFSSRNRAVCSVIFHHFLSFSHLNLVKHLIKYSLFCHLNLVQYLIKYSLFCHLSLVKHLMKYSLFSHLNFVKNLMKYSLFCHLYLVKYLIKSLWFCHLLAVANIMMMVCSTYFNICFIFFYPKSKRMVGCS